MVAKSPYANTSDQMYQFWLDFKKLEPKAQLSGMFANKPGYHNTFNNLPANDYSKVGPKDKGGRHNIAAAIDITLPLAQMKKYSSRLLKSGRDMKDNRGNFLREFYGNVDGNSYVDGWDFQAVCNVSSDDSHLWHIHVSILRSHVDNAAAYDALLSILRGETFAAYQKRHGGKAPAAPKPPAKPKPVFATVKAGNTLIGLAKAYKVTYAQLQKLNPQKKGHWDSLNIGERIRVK